MQIRFGLPTATAGYAMAKGYSKDLRERGVSTVEAGESAREAARLLNAGASTATRWIKRWTKTRRRAWCSLTRPRSRRQWSITTAAAPRGERPVASVPHGHWKTLTFIAALRFNRMTAPYVIDGAMDGPTFIAYVEQVLIPT